MNHVTYMNESCHTYEWAMSHIWMSHVTHVNELCHICERVMSNIWMSDATHMNESRHAYKRVMSHIWVSRVTHMNESCHTYAMAVSHIWRSHVPFEMFVTVQCRGAQPTPWPRGSLEYGARICLEYKSPSRSHKWSTGQYKAGTSSYLWRISFMYVMGLIYMCGRIRSYVWHDSFVWMAWLYSHV